MIQDLETLSKDMRELGLAALSHVNNSRIIEDKWSGILSVLQTAHAMEILTKARIAEEHPLLLFDTYPKPQKDMTNKITSDLSIDQLTEKGRTIEWSQIIETLWLVAGIKSVNIDAFSAFGKLRNTIQHFGICQENTATYLTSLRFIYEVIDPFIYDCWGLYAVDCCQDFHEEESGEDNIEYWNYIKDCLVQNEIRFLISPRLIQNTTFWWDSKNTNLSSDYINYIQFQIDNQNLPD